MIPARERALEDTQSFKRDWAWLLFKKTSRKPIASVVCYEPKGAILCNKGRRLRFLSGLPATYVARANR